MVTIAYNVYICIYIYYFSTNISLCRKKRQGKATTNGKSFALPMKVVRTDPQEQVGWIENGGKKSTGEKETVATSENGAAAVAAEDAEDYFEDISAVGIYYSNSVYHNSNTVTLCSRTPIQ